jgi:hypothetical protein
MAQTRLLIGTTPLGRGAPSPFARSRRGPLKRRVLLTLIGLAIVLLALGGWVAQALRLPR